jgi:hypothetical protein
LAVSFFFASILCPSLSFSFIRITSNVALIYILDMHLSTIILYFFRRILYLFLTSHLPVYLLDIGMCLAYLSNCRANIYIRYGSNLATLIKSQWID